jgi:adenosylcobinamide-phosphate synthase
VSYRARAAGLIVGYATDALFGDPRRGHPVAGFGQAAGALERRVWADSRARGVGFTVACVGATIAVGQLTRRAARRVAGPELAELVVTAAATWAVLGGRSLAAEGQIMYDLLAQSQVDAARSRLSHLAGRDPEGLDSGQLARATVESLAENTSDAVVAPLVWGAVAGVPGLLGYRAVNTLDAMVGHRSSRYARFGWASARLDDAANLVPARLSALLAAATAPLVSGSPTAAVRAWWRDADKHPSPNAGPVEASFAGALGVTLGGTNTYGQRVENRGTLGDGPPPGVPDIPRAIRLSRAVGLASLATAAVATLAIGARRRGRKRGSMESRRG